MSNLFFGGPDAESQFQDELMGKSGGLHYKLSVLLGDTLATTKSITDNINSSVGHLAVTTQDSNVIFQNIESRFGEFKNTLDSSLDDVFSGSLNIDDLMSRADTQIETEAQDGFSLTELALFNANQNSEIRVLKSEVMVNNSLNVINIQQVSNRVDFLTSQLKWRSVMLGVVLTGMSIL